MEVRGDDHRYLRLTQRPPRPDSGPLFRVADLFAGGGGLSLGVREACEAVGGRFESALVAEVDPDAMATYQANFQPSHTLADPIERHLDGRLGSRLTARETALKTAVGPIDLLVGGPPCQGHSDLNNSTRRSDPRNSLYLRMARAAEVFEPAAILIENVVGARHDRGGVVQRTEDHLLGLGYPVSSRIADALRLGVPQTRRRHIVAAAVDGEPDLAGTEARLARPGRDLRFAIGDLEDASGTIMDEPGRSQGTTRARIDYLFDHGLYDLPDSERPACHREKAHTYKSIYGRLQWDRPAQTVTRGFYCMCMGRYVHPSRRRTLTAREAARIQFFPDFFDFAPARTRTRLARVIGNAVPTKLAWAGGLALLDAMGHRA